MNVDLFSINSIQGIFFSQCFFCLLESSGVSNSSIIMYVCIFLGVSNNIRKYQICFTAARHTTSLSITWGFGSDFHLELFYHLIIFCFFWK